MTKPVLPLLVTTLLLLALLIISGCSGANRHPQKECLYLPAKQGNKGARQGTGLNFKRRCTAAGLSKKIKGKIADFLVNHEVKKAGLSGKTLEVNNKTISALESCKIKGGPAVVLVHGFGANKENWLRFAGHLTESYRVVAIDLPGHGRSTKKFDIDYSIEAQANYLHEIIISLGLRQIHLAGNSMGGAISSVYAAEYPEQVRSLTLINSGGINDFESEMIKQLLSGGENPLIIESREDFDRMLDFALEKKPFLPWPLKSVFAERAAANRELNEKIFLDIALQDTGEFKKSLAGIEAPTLIIWGDKDRILDVRNAEVFAENIQNSRLHIFEDVGHAPMMEVPEAAAKVFLEFISSADQVDPAVFSGPSDRSGKDSSRP